MSRRHDIQASSSSVFRLPRADVKFVASRASVMPARPPLHRPTYASTPPPTQSREACDRQRGSAASRGYDHRWRAFRASVLASNPLCADCMTIGRLTPTTGVHHVVKPRAAPERRLDESDCRALCASCHGTRTARGGGVVLEVAGSLEPRGTRLTPSREPSGPFAGAKSPETTGPTTPVDGADGWAVETTPSPGASTCSPRPAAGLTMTSACVWRPTRR